MSLEKLKGLLESSSNVAKFKEVLDDTCWSRGDKEDFCGLEIEGVSAQRTEGTGDYDGYQWVFKIDGELCMVFGSYSSWDGAEMDLGSIRDVYRCKEKVVTKTVYVIDNGK